jgi:hypothetical protein
MKIRGGGMLRNIVLICLVFSTLGVVFAGSKPAGAARTAMEGLLVSPELLERAALEMCWQVNLPLKESEQIDRIYVFEKYVYVLTNSNFLFCIDKEKKAVRFVLQLAIRGLPICEPLYHEGDLWFMVGNELRIVSPETKKIEKRKRLRALERGAVGAMVRNKKRLYVLANDKRLHSLVIEGFWQDFMVAAPDGSRINSLVADDKFLVFTTEAGNVFSIYPNQAKRRWQYDVVGEIVAPLVSQDEWLYVGSTNTKLYKINIRNGRTEWDDTFHAGGELKKPPMLGARVLYQSTDNKGVYAIDKETGRMVWQAPRGVDVMVEVGVRAYVFAEPGVLVVMDNAEARQLYSVNFANVKKYAINTVDKALYVAGLKGRVMCIAEKSR